MKDKWYSDLRVVGGHGTSKPKRSVLLAIAAAATSLISFGLGITSKSEVADLKAAVDNLGDNQRFLVATMTELARAQLKYEFTLEQTRWGIFDSKLVAAKRDAIMQLEAAGRAWTRGLFHLVRGELDPSVITVDELAKGLALVQQRASQVGMRVAPMENQMESLFSLPATTMVEGTTIHVWVSVPLIPDEMSVLEVLHLEHVPLPFDKYMVSLNSKAPYLAIDASRRMHIELSASDLASCDRHKQMYFCDFSSFSTTVDGCAVALLRGDRDKAGQFCERYVHKAPLVVSKPAHNSTSQNITVFSGHTVSVERICPHGSALPTTLVSGNATLLVPYGCYLRAADKATFIPHQPKTANVACHGDEWHPEELLDGLNVDDVVEAIAHLNFTDGKLPLTRIKQVHVLRQTSWYIYAVIAAAAIALVVLIELGVRYYFSVRSYMRKLPPQQPR